MTDRELLERLGRVLAPLDSKIDHSLHVGTVEQMRADLTYMRGLLGQARDAIAEQLTS